jgi:hypothetical protein
MLGNRPLKPRFRTGHLLGSVKGNVGGDLAADIVPSRQADVV